VLVVVLHMRVLTLLTGNPLAHISCNEPYTSDLVVGGCNARDVHCKAPRSGLLCVGRGKCRNALPEWQVVESVAETEGAGLILRTTLIG
jgi:hypothetical protein